MADSYLDLPSSPDPLADDDVPAPVYSSARPSTQRIGKTMPQHELSAISIPPPSSSMRYTSPSRRSPRKRTFELDVGNEKSPQRILVTVEAEEDMRRGTVSRRLFESPSPSRKASPTRTNRRREAITTTVPLNDDPSMLAGDNATPRKRGRPRGSSNGTPMPKTRKRAATPMKRASKKTRADGEPASETGIMSDAPTDTIEDAEEDTPKVPKPRARKTPKKAPVSSAAPSSQTTAKSTGRKRGRPRKVQIAEDVNDVMSETGAEAHNTGHGADAVRPASELPSELAREEDPAEHENDAPADHSPYGEGDGTPIPANPDTLQKPESAQRMSESPAPSYGEDPAEYDDAGLSDGFPAMEPQSDFESDAGGVTYSGQDNLTHASDFSMIAVESLPSFHASFHANVSRIPEEPEHEMGEETNMMISRTMESLRRSWQNEGNGNGKSPAQPAHAAAYDLSSYENGDEDRDELQEDASVVAGNSRARAFSKSPRRPKSTPLSRQIFAAKTPRTNDSFSSIPDSILKAATPGPLSAKPISASNSQQDESMYDDSFSEIPDAVLEAATPAPMKRTVLFPEEANHSSSPRHEPSSTNRSSGTNLGSSRLPTPDDTSSSSHSGSKRSHEDDIEADIEPTVASFASLRQSIPSSPLTKRPIATDLATSDIQHELNDTPERRHSAPTLPPSSKNPSDRQRSRSRSKSVDVTAPSRRPTLSPIVRAGRTLQNVMSDRSSPEGRESSLGSPFRGSFSNEPPHQMEYFRQSSRSPAPSSQNRKSQSNARRPSFAAAALAQSVRSSLSNHSRNNSRDIIGTVEDPFGPDMHDNSHSESLKRSAYVLNDKGSAPAPSVKYPSLASSTRAMPSSDDQMSGQDDTPSPKTTRKENPQEVRSANSSFATQGTNLSDTLAARAAELENSLRDDENDEMVDEMQDEESHSMADGEDDFDLWDVEASRSSPRKPQVPVAASQPTEAPPTRRSKIPSPWRKTSRRLIYQDEIISPTQIEIEESAQSEVEEAPSNLARPRQSIVPPQPQSDSEPESQSEPEPEPASEHRDQLTTPEDEIGAENDEANIQDVIMRGGLEDSGSESGHEEIRHEADDLPEEHQNDELQESAENMGPTYGSEYSIVAEREEETSDRQTTKHAAPVDTTEYSLVQQQQQNDSSSSQAKPSAKKSRLLGGFDILSFFSSPATVPPMNAPESKPAPIAQPKYEKPAPKQPQTSIWGSGLFPSIPQKEFRPSPERRVNLFSREGSREPSRGPILPSNDTVADTYGASSSPSPSRSAAPSTPERDVFPPIQQKRNFTPKPGRSGSSLFAPGPTTSSHGRNQNDNRFLQIPSDEPDESSILTEGSEYERVPPREVPSRWDRHLSPSKSAFRSPLKPTTPGRVVAFANNGLSPLAQAQGRMNGANVNTQPVSISSDSSSDVDSEGDDTTISPGPSKQSALRGKENQPVPAIRINATNTVTDSKTASSSSASLRKPSTRPKTLATALSPAAWSKQHWIRLDELLQLRRRDPLQFQLQCPLPPRAQRRGSAAVLGKEVRAQGDSLVIEAWHLDVIDAFRLEVGGVWDESALAKRVFGLVVGEQRRRAGRVIRGNRAKVLA
ncbi:hypothetical protein F5Y15DRAFT_411870 [Xylariaceae sp. FL0016]|nr:hypothetical protein F5Y15DRAFT_411870 [Xylariaceae sp. FL0016]